MTITIVPAARALKAFAPDTRVFCISCSGSIGSLERDRCIHIRDSTGMEVHVFLHAACGTELGHDLIRGES